MQQNTNREESWGRCPTDSPLSGLQLSAPAQLPPPATSPLSSASAAASAQPVPVVPATACSYLHSTQDCEQQTFSVKIAINSHLRGKGCRFLPLLDPRRRNWPKWVLKPKLWHQPLHCRKKLFSIRFLSAGDFVYSESNYITKETQPQYKKQHRTSCKLSMSRLCSVILRKKKSFIF